MDTGTEKPRIVIYTTTYCGFCRRAEALLDERKLRYEQIDVTDDDEARAQLVERANMRTVPVIFIDGQPIGGYTDLAALARTGELDRRLAQPPAAR